MFGFMAENRPTPRRAPSIGRTPPRRRHPRREPYAEPGVEPALEDLLNDPVTEAIMRCDGVSATSLRSLISATRQCLRSRETVA